MNVSRYRKALESLLEGTDIQINGLRPWDIAVHNEKFYSRVLADGSLALAESYFEIYIFPNSIVPRTEGSALADCVFKTRSAGRILINSLTV